MMSLPVGTPPLAIIVMGVSGSGKSTFGRQLATRLAAPFLEGDDFHPFVNVQKMSAGMPLEDTDRWPWLDGLADGFIAEGLRNRLVVGTCSALKYIYRQRLRERIPVPILFVCLLASQRDLCDRVTHRSGHFMPPGLLASQFAALEVPNATEFALCLDSTRPSVELFAQVDAMLAKY